MVKGLYSAICLSLKIEFVDFEMLVFNKCWNQGLSRAAAKAAVYIPFTNTDGDIHLHKDLKSPLLPQPKFEIVSSLQGVGPVFRFTYHPQPRKSNHPIQRNNHIPKFKTTQQYIGI